LPPTLTAALAGTLAVVASLIAPAAAAPAPDLKPYPAPATGERRWIIQLPQQPPSAGDPRLPKGPEDWRVELIVGRQALVDCNLHRLGGRIRSETVPGWGYSIHRVSDVGPMLSTRMACPPDQPKRQKFVTLGGDPFLVPFNPRLPIVVYAPQDLEVRWRLWRAENPAARAEVR
jgi:ecotin